MFCCVVNVNEKKVNGKYDEIIIAPQSNNQVVMLNKPAGFITTVNDPLKRKTVMDLVQTDERLFPIGRLDKDTTGLLLLTNNPTPYD